MNELIQDDPTGRFSGLAALYARHRPDYPAQAIDLLVARGNLDASSLVIDVGCGTGIASRQLAAHGIPVLGIEPNDDMRRQAEEAGIRPALRFQAGQAEATGLADGLATMVLAAQAFHWFDAPRALAEFHRILRPGGWVALMWNERDESDPFTAAYGQVIRLAPDAPRTEGARVSAGLALLDCPHFEARERIECRHQQDLDEEGVLGRAFSVSYAPRESPLRERFVAGLREAFARFQQDGRVRLCYVTTVFLGRKAGERRT